MDGNAFVVPPRLRARRRRVPGDARDTTAIDASAAPPSSSSFHFFTQAGYTRFSESGGAPEATLYWDEEQRRATCLALSSTPAPAVAKQPLAENASAENADNASASSGAATAPRAKETVATKAQTPLKSPAVLQATTASAAAVAASTRAVAPAAGLPHARKHLTQIMLEKKFDGKMRVRVENTCRRLSALTILQHELYMQLLQKRIHAQRCGLPAILALSADELTQLQALEPIVKEEQALFCHAFETITKSDGAAVLAQSNVPAFADTWYEKMMMRCRNDVFQMYPRYFEPCLKIGTQTLSTLPGEISVMKHVKEVFSYGSCPTFDEAWFETGSKMAIVEGDSGAGESFLFRNAISADIHAEMLMKKFDCDVAMSSSTLLALFDIEKQKSSSLHRQWVIPIKNRVFVNAKGSSKKHVYFDKPLPAEVVGAREKMSSAGRAHILSTFQAKAMDANKGVLQITRDSSVIQGKVAYHVWELDGRRILVRFTTHALLASMKKGGEEAQSSSGPPESKIRPVSVFVKPDYKYLGVEEEITPSEKRRFWLHSWLRGSSTVLIGRLNPESSVVETWETHSLASLVYGRDGYHSPEWFEPTEHFQLVNEIVAATCSVPVGNYMLRSPSSDSRTGDVELLMAASGGSGSDANNAGESVNGECTRIDLFQFIGGKRVSSDVYEYVLPKWTYVPGRIPYSFRTGTYCLPFFLDGICPTIAAGDEGGCDAVHLRPSRSSNFYWQFEDYSKIVKIAKNVELPLAKGKFQPHWIKPKFPLCQDARSVDPSNPHAPVRCPKPKGECLLPHLTIHEVAERIADKVIHDERAKRKRFKQKNRDQRNGIDRSAGWQTR
uniref:Little elongation complex subunit 2 C-terminal domain-containing protein n=1 Tax=Globisporangium ultimum (strain ATCC 200006 / CBS 805.95 / DAOM BR144) TaxID=431595 RepID=K3WBH1_GLOUD